MTTVREDVRDALQTALQDIATANTYDEGGVVNYRTDPTTVEYQVQAPEQADETTRPYIGFKQRGSISNEDQPCMMTRERTPWRIYVYPDLSQANLAAQRTQANALLADCEVALWKALRVDRFGNCIHLVDISGKDVDEGRPLAEKGFASLDIETIRHRRIDAN